ncbi:LOW QUALITY PROTEIN: hypothetical protein ACHAWF_003284 [Thalassiosira exigua]
MLGSPSNNVQLVWNEVSQNMLSRADGECLESWDCGATCNREAPLLLLQIANSIWFDDRYALHPEYELVLCIAIFLAAKESSIIVNGWVKNSTNGLIYSIVDECCPIYPPYVLVAINSIYLKVIWETQFDKSLTNIDSFCNSASRTKNEVSEAHFMNIVDYFRYSHYLIPGYQVIELSFAESGMSMILTSPLTDELDAVQSTELLPALNGLESTYAVLSLPKFKFESKNKDNLKDALMQSGIVAPFSGGFTMKTI